MSYSRRELYALGEPIGDSATYRKVDGGLVLGDGGGGGSAPANTTTQQTQELPEWARGYAKDVLSKGQALTDISKNPYQTYGGDRTADFSNLQKQSFAQAGPQGFQSTVGQYMSPYVDQVIQNQIASSNRGYDISGANEAARATQAGAFGGGRQAIMQAENERARNSANQNITAQGLQNAFQGATGQYNTGIQQLATLGGQQQAQRQRELDIPYQEFINQQNQPYKQLSYMSDLIRGTPLGMQASNQVYQAPPSAIQNITGLGLGAAGIAQLAKADGGMVHDYAGGGSVQGYSGRTGSVTSSENVEDIVQNIKTDQELQTALKAAAARRDMETVQAIQQEMAFRASMRNGLAGAVTPDMSKNMIRAAGGGILAFAGDDEENDPMTGQMVSSPGDPRAYGNFNQELLRSMGAIRDFKPVGMTAKEYNDAISNRYALLGKMAGPDPYADQSASLEEQQKAMASNEGIGRAAALFKAANAVVQGNNAIRGLAGAGAAYGEEAIKAAQAGAAEKRALSSMKFNLLDAQRKERMGMSRDAIEAANQARKDKSDLNAAEIAKQKALGSLAASGARATKPTGTGAGGKEFIAGPAAYLGEVKELYPNWSPAKQQAEAFRRYQQGKAAGYQGAKEKTDVASDALDLKRQQFEAEELRKTKIEPDYKDGTPEKKAAMEADAKARAAKRAAQAVIPLARGGTITPIKLD
jgi:hypothetical protein